VCCKCVPMQAAVTGRPTKSTHVSVPLRRNKQTSSAIRNCGCARRHPALCEQEVSRINLRQMTRDMRALTRTGLGAVCLCCARWSEREGAAAGREAVCLMNHTEYSTTIFPIGEQNRRPSFPLSTATIAAGLPPSPSLFGTHSAMGRLHRTSLGDDVQTELDRTERHLGPLWRWNVEPAMIFPLPVNKGRFVYSEWRTTLLDLELPDS
jgi:hypothetical protein